MTGYRWVFDREEMVLGWEEADCKLVDVFILILYV